jgi:hypothetical protein
MKGSLKITSLLPPLPLQQGERIEVRGSGTAIELKLQTLSLQNGEAK